VLEEGIAPAGGLPAWLFCPTARRVDSRLGTRRLTASHVHVAYAVEEYVANTKRASVSCSWSKCKSLVVGLPTALIKCDERPIMDMEDFNFTQATELLSLPAKMSLHPTHA